MLPGVDEKRCCCCDSLPKRPKQTERPQRLLRTGELILNVLSSLFFNEVLSSKQDAFKVRNFLHAGMLKKPLEPYSPNAHRSRLPSPTVIMPYKNSSSIMIGDRSCENRRQFITSNTNNFHNPSMVSTSNGGIISEKTKWKKHLQDL